MVVSLSNHAQLDLDVMRSGLSAAGLGVVPRDERQQADKAHTSATVDGVRSLQLEAKGAYRQLNVEQAATLLDEAHQKFFTVVNAHQHRGLLVEVLLARAELALTVGNADDAERDLQLAARLRGASAPLHPGLYAPNVVEADARVRAKEAGLALGLVVLQEREVGQSTPGATSTLTLLVDGVEQAVPDAGRLTLPYGEHWVTLLSSSGSQRHQRIRVGAQPVQLSFLHAPSDAAQRRRALRAKLAALQASSSQAWLVPLTEMTQVSSAGLFVVVRHGHAPLVAHPTHGVEALPVRADADATVVGQAVQRWWQDKTTPKVVRQVPPTPVAAGDDEASASSAALWVGLGAAAVGSVVVILASGALALWAVNEANTYKEEQPRPYQYVEVTCCGAGS